MNDESHTEQMNRLLAFWIHLRRIVRERDQSGARVVPWECQDKEVATLWEQITQPRNQFALEEWLFQVTPGELELWARQALLECRRRCKQSAK